MTSPNASDQQSKHALPSGTLTFLFSDIEASTVRWEFNRAAMQEAVRRHDALMHEVIERHGGVVFKTVGDAFCVVFPVVADAIAAALDAQRAVASEDWSAVGGLAVRMALHTGDADERNGDYFGPVVNRVARLVSVGHGGQVLVSGVAADLGSGAMPAMSALRDLGSHRLKDLAYPEQIYQLIAPDLRVEFPPLRTLDVLPNNLPLQLTPFFGREEEVAAIKTLLGRSRLVTLVGSGGIGKTRAALQVAAELLDRYADGAWLIELAPLRDAAVIEGVLASELGIRATSMTSNENAILDVLRPKCALLVFDNCEHLVRDAAITVDRILRHCPQVTILTTSREALSIAGELTFRMPSLQVPRESAGLRAGEAMRYDAVNLFVERARAANDGFVLTDDNAPTVAEICRQLDGIALAIELAAPRIKVLSPHALLDRLKERFRLLAGGNRAALPRQQTMRALIDWSYDLLSEAEQRVFRRVAVFAGGCTIEAATAVCTDDELEEWDLLELLSALVDKSLIVTELGAHDQRYRLLESTRHYARERLAQSGEEVRFLRAHAEYVASFTHEIAQTFWQVPLLRSAARVWEELDNLRAALTWTLSEGNDTRLGISLAADASRAFLAIDVHAEAISWLNVASPFVDATTPLAVRALLDLGLASLVFVADLESVLQATRAAAAAYRELGDQARLGEVLQCEGMAFYYAGKIAEAAQPSKEGVAILAQCDVPLLYAWALRGRSVTLDDAAERIRFLEEARGIYRSRGDDGRVARVLQWLAEDQFANGQIEAAVGTARETLSILRTQARRSNSLAIGLMNLAGYLLWKPSPHEAYPAAAEALRMGRDLASEMAIVFSLQHLAVVAALTGRAESAAQILGYVDRRAALAGRSREFTEQSVYDRTMAQLRDELGADRVAALMAAGTTLLEDIAVAEALIAPVT